MGDVVQLVTAGHRGDLDTKAQVAALTVMAMALVEIMDGLPEGGVASITLNDERRQVTRGEGMALAHDMLTQREEALAAIGRHAADGLLAELDRALGVVREAHAVWRRRQREAVAC